MNMLGTETDDRGRIQIYVYMNKNDYVFDFYYEHTMDLVYGLYDFQPHLSLEFSSLSC